MDLNNFEKIIECIENHHNGLLRSSLNKSSSEEVNLSKSKSENEISNKVFNESLYEAFHYFKYCEILNFIVFILTSVRPPCHSNLILNFHFKKAEVRFPSYTEIPSNENNISILLDCLEFSIIIKLWCALLTEKHVILIGSRGLLYPICSALLSLIYPFKWMHTYIPVLPDVYSFEILDSPPPIFVGIPKNRHNFHEADFTTLCQDYPYYVICDLNTNQISQVNIPMMPEQDEIKLRTKVRFLRYPKLDVLEDLGDEKINEKVVDVDPNRSFSRNIQNIFFRIFKDNLCHLEDSIKNNKYKKFDQRQFLDEYESSSTRTFWEEVTNTQAFENFLLGLKLADDDNITRFRNLRNVYDISSNNYTDPLHVEYSVPDTINYIFHPINEILEAKHKSFSTKNFYNTMTDIDIKLWNQIKDQVDYIDFLIQNYKLVLTEVLKIKHHEDFDENVFNSLFELKPNYSNINYDKRTDNLIPTTINTSISKFSDENGGSVNSLNSKLTNNSDGLNLEKKLSKICIEFKKSVSNKSNLSENKKRTSVLASFENTLKTNTFSVYGLNGLIHFLKDIFNYEILESKIEDQINLNGFLNNFLCQEVDNTSNIKIKICLNECLEFKNSSISSIMCNQNIISIGNNSKRLGQYYSLMAYLVEENYPDKIQFIFNMYFMACFNDEPNFPKSSFYNFAKNLSSDILKTLIDSMTHLSVRLYFSSDIRDFKIYSKRKKKRSNVEINKKVCE